MTNTLFSDNCIITAYFVWGGGGGVELVESGFFVLFQTPQKKCHKNVLTSIGIKGKYSLTEWSRGMEFPVS